jgi:hypothetical protein
MIFAILTVIWLALFFIATRLIKKGNKPDGFIVAGVSMVFLILMFITMPAFAFM